MNSNSTLIINKHYGETPHRAIAQATKPVLWYRAAERKALEHYIKHGYTIPPNRPLIPHPEFKQDTRLTISNEVPLHLGAFQHDEQLTIKPAPTPARIHNTQEKTAEQLTEISNDLRERECKYSKSFDDYKLSGRKIINQLLKEGSVSMLEYLQLEPAIRKFTEPFEIKL